MINLLQETIETLHENNKTMNDVLWVGNREYRIDMNKFLTLADTEYDEGFGGTEVAEDLILVGKDFWLERGEYDGSEWWEYKEYPKIPFESKDIKYLTKRQAWDDDIRPLWDELKDINEGN